MSPETVEIMGFPIHCLTMEETLEMMAQLVERPDTALVCTPNPEVLVAARGDDELRRALLTADLLLPDGVGLIWASGFLGTPLPQRVTGIDLVQQLFQWGQHQGSSFYFLGGRPGVAEMAARRVKEGYPGLKICGVRHGYYRAEEKEELLEEINCSHPDLLLVGMGVPRQEYFILEHRDQLKASLCLTVGGSFDVLAGRVKRAPVIYQRLRLEWFYRLLQEPMRWRRMLRLPAFVLLILGERLRRGFK